MPVILTPLYDAQTIRRRVDELADEITRAYAGQELTAIVIMNGGFFFAADLLRHVNLPVRVDSLPAGSYVHHASTGQLTMRGSLKLDVKGRHVLLIDKEIPPEQKKTKADWYGFRAPAQYLVGCGMDSDELYRNLPDICILREE